MTVVLVSTPRRLSRSPAALPLFLTISAVGDVVAMAPSYRAFVDLAHGGSVNFGRPGKRFDAGSHHRT